MLTDIRLTHARQLLGEENSSILHVALESGFADTAALNKAFGAEYGVTPSEYRKQERQKNSRTREQEDESSELDRKVRDFFRKEGADYRTEEASVQRLFADTSQFRRMAPFWSRMINGGRASDMLKADVQMQIFHLCREIGFQYIRIWDLWSPEIMLYSGKGSYNFSVMDAIMAFLYDNHLRPYLELGFKPIQINSDYFRPVYYEERRRPFETIEACWM